MQRHMEYASCDRTSKAEGKKSARSTNGKGRATLFLIAVALLDARRFDGSASGWQVSGSPFKHIACVLLTRVSVTKHKGA